GQDDRIGVLGPLLEARLKVANCLRVMIVLEFSSGGAEVVPGAQVGPGQDRANGQQDEKQTADHESPTAEQPGNGTTPTSEAWALWSAACLPRGDTFDPTLIRGRLPRWLFVAGWGRGKHR